MNNFRIYTESKADTKFLKDYIQEIFSLALNDGDFDTLGGWSGYKVRGTLNASIQQNNLNEKISILILDADVDFKQRQQEVISDFQSFDIPFDLFFFPNNSSAGNLESLLAEIAADKKLMDCFLEYEKCVSLYPKKLNDSRIYSYLDMLLHENNKDENGKDLRKEENRNYRNQDHWNLHSTYLDPLKGFLTKHMT